MLCQTCQRQSRCLTHQLADQDQNLQRMLEQLQTCQRHRPTPFHLPQKPYLLQVIRWMERLSQEMARYFRTPGRLFGKQKP